MHVEDDTFDTNEQNIDEVAHGDRNNDPKMGESQGQSPKRQMIQNNEFTYEEDLDDAKDWNVYMDIKNVNERKTFTKQRKSERLSQINEGQFSTTVDVAETGNESMMQNLESDLEVIGGCRGDLILVGENLISKKSETEPMLSPILRKKYKPKPKSKQRDPNHSTPHEEHFSKMKSKNCKIGNDHVNSMDNLKNEINGDDSADIEMLDLIMDLIILKKGKKQKSENMARTKVKVTIDENRVYLIKIPIPPENLTLADLKKKMPQKGPFQYFVKTILEDGDTGFEEYDDDSAILPLHEDKIIVECNTI